MEKEEVYPKAWYLDLEVRRGNTGFLVRTYKGKAGRTYHKEDLVNGKIIVHVEDQKLPMLCDPTTITLIDLIVD